MKYILYILLLLPFVSCVSKKDANKLTASNDSLQIAVMQKDSALNDVFLSMNAIAENLNAIKQREGLINTSLDSEMGTQKAAQISRDIEEINRLLIENRETIDRLRKTSSQLTGAKAKISGLEKLISQLNLQVESKDQEIQVLKSTIASMRIQVDSLSGKVSGLSDRVGQLSRDNTSLEGEIKAKVDMINIGYYIVGPEKDLLSKEIVYKKGFIGRTLKINENRSLDNFTQVDIRNFDELVIGGKKATIISSHPPESYEFVANSNGVYDVLKILDKDRFWEYSKVLVVGYK